MGMIALFILAFQEAEPKPLKIQVEGDGLAAKYPGDAGIAKDERVVFVEDFESGDLKRWSETKDPEIVDEAHSGKKAIRFTATLGKDTGGHLYKMLEPARETLHFR